MRGTNTGAMPGGPPTGKTIDLPGADFLEYDPAADKLSRVVGYFDTATMLVARAALIAIIADLDEAGAAAARLATDHAETVMAGRTLLQQALPTTFGGKAAGWLSGLDDAAELLASIRDRRLAVQFGGGAGTLAAVHPHGPEVIRLMAAELGLAAPDMPWHTNRSRIGELAGQRCHW